MESSAAKCWLLRDTLLHISAQTMWLSERDLNEIQPVKISSWTRKGPQGPIHIGKAVASWWLLRIWEPICFAHALVDNHTPAYLWISFNWIRNYPQKQKLRGRYWYKIWEEAREVALQIRLLSTLAEDLSSVRSTHNRNLTNAWNSASRSCALIWPS